MVSSELLDPDKAAGAAITCWSGIHGFAMLTSCGPLRGLPQDVVDARAEQLVADVVQAVRTR